MRSALAALRMLRSLRARRKSKNALLCTPGLLVVGPAEYWSELSECIRAA